MSSDEDACDICEGDKSSKKNPIIFCDGEDCNLPVHKLCYKVDEVPEDDWFCQKCDNKKKNKPAKIICCPIETRAARHTVTFGEFMHVVCATWNKDINSDLEPYSFNKKLLGTKTCFLCDKSKGLCIDCGEPGCSNAFHVTCAINNGLITPSITLSNQFSARCSKHQPSFPLKKQNARRTLRPGKMIDSDEESASDLSEGMDIDSKKPEPSKPAEMISSDDDDEDDMGSSKKSKSGGPTYREILEAKKRKPSVESVPFDKVIKKPSISTSPLLNKGLGLAQRPLKKTTSPMELDNRPRWVSQINSQPTTPSISGQKSFFDTERKPEETGKLREEIRKITLEKEDAMRALNRMTDDYNRLREDKKKWFGFKQAVAEVFTGLNIQSPGPTPDTIEQYVAQIQSMMKRSGPITDEERVLIEEASKSIKPK